MKIQISILLFYPVIIVLLYYYVYCTTVYISAIRMLISILLFPPVVIAQYHTSMYNRIIRKPIPILLFLPSHHSPIVGLDSVRSMSHSAWREGLPAYLCILSRATSHGAPWLRWPEDGTRETEGPRALGRSNTPCSTSNPRELLATS